MKTDSGNKIVSIIDQRVLAIPVIENNDPMIDLIEQDRIAFGPPPEIPNNKDYTKIRRTVYQKLLAAQKNLPKNLRFCIYEGYRGLALQEKLFNEHYNSLKIINSDWNSEKLFHETVKLASPLINLDGSYNIPPHATGGAFDIYLIDEKNNIVDMGIKVENWMQDIEGQISQTHFSKISDNARKNRMIMYDALKSVEFVNYPGEYWHWSYGDRYWAYCLNKSFALYDIIK